MCWVLATQIKDLDWVSGSWVWPDPAHVLSDINGKSMDERSLSLCLSPLKWIEAKILKQNIRTGTVVVRTHAELRRNMNRRKTYSVPGRVFALHFYQRWLSEWTAFESSWRQMGKEEKSASMRALCSPVAGRGICFWNDKKKKKPAFIEKSSFQIARSADSGEN